MRTGKGVKTAFVTEIDPKQGRIKVEYRGIETRLESAWAYMAAPMSGKGRGALFMPEKGDEVLVCFGDGDFGHPYVVGFLWNGEHTSPETEAQNRVIVTPGGHHLRFEDKPNAKKVVLRTDGKRELLLDDKPAAGKVQLTSSEHRVLLDDLPGGSKIEIKAGKAVGVTITLNATPTPSLSIQVGATNTIDVGPAGVNITVGGSAQITAAGTTTITAAGAVNVSASTLNVTSALTTFSGVVVASAVITNSIVSPVYSPGIGNLI